MRITPVIRDGYHGGPIKQLTCRICKRLFYITQADYDSLQEVPYCHECSIVLLAELEKVQGAPTAVVQKANSTTASAAPIPPIHIPQPRTIDRDKMTVEQLLGEAKMLCNMWRYQEALSSYDEILQRNPVVLGALYGKGEMLRKLNR